MSHAKTLSAFKIQSIIWFTWSSDLFELICLQWQMKCITLPLITDVKLLHTQERYVQCTLCSAEESKQKMNVHLKVITNEIRNYYNPFWSTGAFSIFNKFATQKPKHNSARINCDARQNPICDWTQAHCRNKPQNYVCVQCLHRSLWHIKLDWNIITKG